MFCVKQSYPIVLLDAESALEFEKFIMSHGQMTVVYAIITIIPMKRMTMIFQNVARHEITQSLCVIPITLIKLSILDTLTNSTNKKYFFKNLFQNFRKSLRKYTFHATCIVMCLASLNFQSLIIMFFI